MHSGYIVAALARYFNWYQNTMMTEWWIDGGRADVLFVSRAGYVTEIEVKTSGSDWRADLLKDKWKRPRPHVARFFYAVPIELAEREPPGVPANFGIITVSKPKLGYPSVHIKREAVRVKALKIPDKEIQHWYAACYRRFWSDEVRRRLKE